jgi:predicted molibdopterin-dependent oxidoreductase YjgC
VGFTGQSALEWPREIERGKIRTVFASGDGLIDLLGLHDIGSFSKLEFLAVASDFLNPLCARADLILPALAPFENSGTLMCLDGTVRRLERLVAHPGGAWSSERFFGEVATALGSELHIERSALRSELASSQTAFKTLADGSTGHLSDQTAIPFRTGDMKHAFDTSEPPGRNRFCVIVTESIFPHGSRGAHSPHQSTMPDNFVCGMNADDAVKLGLSEGEYVRLIGEPGELRARVKIMRIPTGYVSVPYGHLDNPAADLGIIVNPDIRITIAKAGEGPDRG